MQNFNELNYFLTLAQAGSFVKAGRLLGISSSALSHSMKNLETRLNLRLLNRSTRNVSLTEAGLQLFEQLFPLYQAINYEIDALSDFLNMPSGLIRINAPAVAAEAVLYPKLKTILNQYPKIRLEIVVDNRWADIVKEGFDMGVRLGNNVAKEMIAVPISTPFKMVLVASPDYLAQQGSPKNIDDLKQHRLVGIKLSAEHGTEMQWEFKNKKDLISFTPKSQFSINNHLRLQAVLDGLGIAWIAHMSVENALNSGKLVELLPEYAITYEPLYLYYPSRRGHSKVFKLIVDALKIKNV
ncbi:TPA: LysR family transcriptional regulator [Haemophilus influenzae]|uniref:LysR family transcriptional regulator n=1 Tax=Haemophilus influenzae TaxID=727 RepID=UPI000CFFA84A|nr:LysR family transcriptional regulator [Haemophilus influenzae]PRI89479.1 HTH-type transcriptional regulator DmlR [Haemophilus influenzae]PRI89672.1 HTH-type transcriptional regulator DmlR [Haemophilus influenzae]PRJ84630.1 HTH-type transcriptional regulator DmlR [Haemophilus influenzae]PRJ93994.1 HTH-type transcriptional regulator DmlR [Haemophilus influenzae]PRK61186.1 HTH-type transcriptional regulator DmlR [Haemophilus influenzae]